MKENKIKRFFMLFVMAVTCSGILFAGERDFEPAPNQAAKVLGATRGKSIYTGFVFINGACLDAPYRVERYGTVLRVNRKQISGEVVSWRAFLTALDLLPASAQEKPKPVPKKKAVAVSEAKAIDDLFGDDEDVPETSSEKPEPASDSDAEEELESDAEITSADIKANARTKAMLKTINKYRTAVDKRLREGQMCFFGNRYAPVFVPSRLAGQFLNVLPGLMSESADGKELFDDLRAKGYPFLSMQVCEDLIANRQDYLKLAERRRKMREESELLSIIESGK